MSKGALPAVAVVFDRIIGGGQAIGTAENGLKVLAWGGLPGERAVVQLTKKKATYGEGIVVEVLEPSAERVSPRDRESYLSTSPWQIIEFSAEQRYKAALIEEAFELHHVPLPSASGVYTDGRQYSYRNKVEFSFWWDKEDCRLDLAFFRRGSHGKIPVEDTSLALPAINGAAQRILSVLRKRGDEAFHFKSLLIRTSQRGEVVTQLYVKDPAYQPFTKDEVEQCSVQGFELIYSNPKSPASLITKRLQSEGQIILTDTILDTPFTYTADSFFQVNIALYEQALRDIKEWIEPSRSVVDFYSGTGSLGLSVSSGHVTLVEVNEAAVHEARKTIRALGREASAEAVLSKSEHVLHYISPHSTIIVDPPRAGLHGDVVDRLLSIRPPRIIYLSCNPVTQARDIALLLQHYEIRMLKGYNFFPRTPHIEHLVVLDKKDGPSLDEPDQAIVQ